MLTFDHLWQLLTDHGSSDRRRRHTPRGTNRLARDKDYPTNSENLILLRFAKAIICFYQIFAVSLHRLSVTAPTHLPLPLNSRRPQDEGKTKAKAN